MYPNDDDALRRMQLADVGGEHSPARRRSAPTSRAATSWYVGASVFHAWSAELERGRAGDCRVRRAG